mmetsp:Transcript_18174/g.61828  ORF Transcript_18174/g.61828 Transcript_18174/m.61828 type:complete len:554 (+) Transcript_18174:151-1812(+)
MSKFANACSHGRRGLSDAGIDKIKEYLEDLTSTQGARANKYFPDLKSCRSYRNHGCVFYAECGDDVFHEAYGLRSENSSEPLQPDDIFSIYSMAKIVTALVGLKCYELGLFKWSDNLDDYIPEFHPSNLRVIVGVGEKHVMEADLTQNESLLPDPNPLGLPTDYWYKTSICTKHIQVRHLFSQQSGFGGFWYGIPSILAILGLNSKASSNILAYPGGLEGLLTANLYTAYFGSSWTKLFLQVNVVSLLNLSETESTQFPCIESILDNAKHLANFGILSEQPGEGQTNGHDYDILAALIEVAWYKKYNVGKRFRDICRDLILEPLGMQETGHHVSNADPRFKDMSARLVPQHIKPIPGDAITCIPIGDVMGHFQGSQMLDRGMAGMYSTVQDFAKLIRLLLNDGVVASSGTRLLRSSSIRAIFDYNYMPNKYNWFTHLDCLSRQGVWGMGGLRNCSGISRYNRDNNELLKFVANPKPYQEICDFQHDFFGWYGIGDTSFYIFPKENAFFIFFAQDFSAYSPGSFDTEDGNEDGRFVLYGEIMPMRLIHDAIVFV